MGSASIYEGLKESGKPTEVYDDYWIWAVNRTERNNRVPEGSGDDSKSGKWLIFEPASTVDAAWEKVKGGVEKGDLGFLAKVSTMRDKHEGGQSSSFVICVYTYDWTDKTDVFRVRAALEDLGFRSRLHYKTDEATAAGQYSAPGKRVSTYSH